MTSRLHHRAAEALDKYVEAAELEGAEGDALPERGAGRAPADRTGAAAARRPGDDQAAGGGGGGAAPLDLLPHVQGDGDHGVSVKRGDPRARSADRRARVAKTTKLYDRTADTVTADEIERIVI